MIGEFREYHGFLDCAQRIGDRLVERAVWQGRCCSWTRAGDRGESRDPAPAGFDLYGGVAGIALFLAELYQVSGNCLYADAARGGVETALRALEHVAESGVGFYSGKVGVAYAAARIADCLEFPSLRTAARRIIECLTIADCGPLDCDIISGAAGVILGLFRVGEALQVDFQRVARQFGEGLIHHARRELHGWSWEHAQPCWVRNITGFSHGASGIAQAFLQLLTKTGAATYQLAAEQALLYERQFFDASAENWLDLRHDEIADWYQQGRIEELKDRLASGYSPAPYSPHHSVSWCHGAPGMIIPRIAAFELSGNPLYREEMLAATRTTKASLLMLQNWSLCHGTSGNCEILLQAAHALDLPELRDLVYSHCNAAVAANQEQDGSWPCGARHGGWDPGLMVGEAGIGLFFLRLAIPGIPSALLVDPINLHGTVAPVRSNSRNVSRQQRASASVYFDRTLRALRRVGHHDALRRIFDRSTIARSSPMLAYDALLRKLHGLSRTPRRRVEEALSIDRAALQLSSEIVDYTCEYINRWRWDRLRREWPDVVLFRPATTRVIAITSSGVEENPGVVNMRAGTVTYVLFRRNHRIHVQQVDPTIGLLLTILSVVMPPHAVCRVACEVAEVEHSALMAAEAAILNCLYDLLDLQVIHASRQPLEVYASGAHPPIITELSAQSRGHDSSA